MKKLGIASIVALCASIQMFGLTTEQIDNLKSLKNDINNQLKKSEELASKAMEDNNQSMKKVYFAYITMYAKRLKAIEDMLLFGGKEYTDQEFNEKMQNILNLK